MDKQIPFLFVWKANTGEEIIYGRDVAHAFNKCYSAGALAALDYYRIATDEDLARCKEKGVVYFH